MDAQLIDIKINHKFESIQYEIIVHFWQSVQICKAIFFTRQDIYAVCIIMFLFLFTTSGNISFAVLLNITKTKNIYLIVLLVFRPASVYIFLEKYSQQLQATIKFIYVTIYFSKSMDAGKCVHSF